VRGSSIVVSVVLLGCAQTRDDAPDSAGGAVASTGGGASSTGAGATGEDPPASGTGSGGASTGTADSAELPKLDVGTDVGTVGPGTGCTAVDILFVIDNSGSMCSYQSSLAQTLPDFADAMFEALPEDTSLHVAITTTSFSDGGSHQEQNCTSVQGPEEIDAAYVTPDEGVGTDNGFQGRLLEYDGRRYFEANTGQPSTRLPMMEWFANAAFSVNCDGGAFEFPAAAAGYAFDPVNAATNDGFVRDEGAVLVIFVLSDEVDQSPEGIDRYRDQILAAKADCGGETCVLTAGLLHAGCVPSQNPFVWQFLGAFTHDPVWGPIADESGYADVVRDTLTSVIAQTCELIPEG
jgi:hypothetical protein